ncbi:TonB-dependent receptor [gamma proteobacterium HdN1]|nr:TonB-dependent receptor [gamma proteobacterium HdN1]
MDFDVPVVPVFMTIKKISKPCWNWAGAKHALRHIFVAAFVPMVGVSVAWSAASVAWSAESSVLSLMELPLNELVNVQIATASLTGSTQADAASWVSTIDESDWRRYGSRYMLDVIKQQPSTQVIPLVAGGDAVAIRGYSNTSSLRGVAILIDGIPMADYSASAPTLYLPHLPLFALTSMELSEGAGSALHGSDAFYGVLGINTFNGSGSAQNRVTASVGSDGYYEAGVRGSVALGEHWSSSLAAVADGQPSQHLDYRSYSPVLDQYVDNRLNNRYDSSFLVSHLNGDLSSQSSLRLSLYRLQYNAHGFPGAGIRQAPFNDNGAEFTTLEMVRIGAERRYSETGKLGFWVYHWDLENSIDLNLGLQNGAVEVVQNAAGELYRRGVRVQLSDTFAELATEWAVELGRDLSSVGDTYESLRNPDGSLMMWLPDTYSNRTGGINSATLEADSRLAGSNWHLVWGGRLDDYSDFGRQRSPRFALLYHLDSENTLKLIYSEAFRAPTAYQLYGSASSILSNPNLKPETLVNHELLWLHQGASSFYQISVFQSRWERGIVAGRIDGDPRTKNQNIGNSRASGVAAQLRWQVAPWRVELDASWTQSRNQTDHLEYGAFPTWILNTRLGYEAAHLRTGFYLDHRLLLGRDDVLAASTNPDVEAKKLPPYHRFDLIAIWQAFEDTEVQAALRNLFNRDNRVPSMYTPGGFPEEARSLVLSVRHGF